MERQVDIIEDFKQYISKHCWALVVVSFLVILVWFPWIIQTVTHIDSEEFILNPFYMYNWDQIGRQGMILTKKVFQLQWFNPYFEKILGYITICAAGVLFTYLFSFVSGKKDKGFIIFPLICFTGGIMAEQFYFDIQIFEIGFGYILLALSVLFSYLCVFKTNYLYGVFAIISMIWSFSTYQTFSLLYVIVSTVCFILLFCNWEIEGENKGYNYWELVFTLIVLFLVSFFANSIMTNLFFSSSDYLIGQIAWGKIPVEQILNTIKTHIHHGLTGATIFYTKLYFIQAVLSVCLVSFRIINIKCRFNWLVICGIVMVQISPFLLTIVMGSMPVARSQLAYPMVLSCNVLIMLRYLYGKKRIFTATLVLIMMICLNQIQSSTRLIYTDILTMNQDIRIAEEIENRINSMTSSDKPVVFIGDYPLNMNPSTTNGEMIGVSIFSMCDEIEPHYFFSSKRACDILKTQGFNYQCVSDRDDMRDIRIFALNMPSWPNEGCILETPDYIIVKLSEDLWIEELQ